MSWTTPEDLKSQLARLWDKGELLRPLVTGELKFPLRLKLKGPGSSDLTNSFSEVRMWVASLSAVPNIRVEWGQVRHAVQGLQSLPQQVWVDTLEDALKILGRQKDADRYRRLVEHTQQTMPALLPWLGANPLVAVSLVTEWPHLLAIVDWLLRHPRPGIYLRQVDIPGIDTKFIETYRTVLSALLDEVLPPDAIDSSCSGLRHFARRYGFREKPAQIRFRILDPRIRVIATLPAPDIALDAESFADLSPPVRRVFITENGINFLAFPPSDHSLVIFGEGYGWDTLARADWMKNCGIHYWGDIDTHGFAILNQLRHYFPHVQSFLMNADTLAAHENHWGEEASQVRHDLPNLTMEELQLYNALRDNKIRKNLRLEQERVGYDWLTRHLDLLDGDRRAGP